MGWDGQPYIGISLSKTSLDIHPDLAFAPIGTSLVPLSSIGKFFLAHNWNAARR
jgi:hypothetical protein